MEPIRLSGFPFDSQITGYGADGLPEYDRASNSNEFADLLKGFFRDGVFSGDALQVLAGSGLTATVGTGGVMVQGRVKHLTTAQTVEFETASSLPRLDRVVVRRDLSNNVRDLVIDVLKGTPATTPAAPTLTRNETVWEICLATVRITANATSVQQSNITDTRLDSSLCGIVAAVLNDFDTDTFYAQVQADLDKFKNEEQAEFNEWFENLQTMLDENVAANLQNQINDRVAITEQSFSKEEKSIARQNIAALSYEAQTLTNEQKAQVRLNIGAGDPVEIVQFIANATYSKGATVQTLVPYDANALYFGALGNIPTAISPASTWLRFGGVGIPGSSYQHSTVDSAIINFDTYGGTTGTLFYIGKFQISDTGAISNKNPTSVTVGPVYMLRKIAQ